MNTLVVLFLILCCVIYSWRKNKKEKDKKDTFVILNTLDYYVSHNPKEIFFKVHRKYGSDFLLYPTLTHQVIFVKLINNKQQTCSVIFTFDSRIQKLVRNLEIWIDQQVVAVCPADLKFNNSTLYQHVLKEIETITDIPLQNYNDDSCEEYLDLSYQYLSTRND